METKDLKIAGGDKVRLKDGKIITVFDIRNNYILASSVDWYEMSDVEEIVERFNGSR